MAKQARKKSVVKAKKRKRARTPERVKAKPKSRTVTKKKKAVRKPKAQPEGIAGKVASAFHTLVDTFKETGTLRTKMGPRGSEP